MNKIQNLIDELIIIRSATHTQKDYNCFTIAIEKAKEYLPENAENQNASPTCIKSNVADSTVDLVEC